MPENDGPCTPGAHVPPRIDRDFVLDDDWNIACLNDVATDHADKHKLSEHIWSYREAASEARPRSVNDMI